MLTGPELGQAIAAAIKLKGVTQRAVAEHFGVKPPSVQDWIKRGTIDKARLPGLWQYFSDVVGPTHWGLQEFPSISGPGADAQPHSSMERPWPFSAEDFDRLMALDRKWHGYVEIALRRAIEECEGFSGNARAA